MHQDSSHRRRWTRARIPTARVASRACRLQGPGGSSRRTAILAAALALPLPGTLAGQQDTHGPPGEGPEEAHHSHGGLHFTHPLVTESVSPDTKVRFDHQYFEFPDGDLEHSGVLEGEYAFTRSFSIEAGVPYSYSATEFGNAELLFKFANYAFEAAGISLGYGLEFVFPTNGTPEEADESPAAGTPATGTNRRAEAGTGPGDRIVRRSPGRTPPPPRLSGGGAGVEGTLGTEEWELAPFLNIGYKRGPVELVAWGIFEIPFNQEEQDEVGTELSYALSAMYHVSPRVQALLELDGAGGISGAAVGEDVANLSPGIRLQLLPDRPLVLGTSVGFPLTDEEGFDVRWKTSLFWHFPR